MIGKKVKNKKLIIKGFGFDTFSGLPEKWYKAPAGSYSSFGSIPKIANGEFIVGKFEDTLSKFFSVKRLMASLINFDADLYSSTICALNNAKNVIDDETILVFDEFLLNNTWEQDEFKALEEFCNNFNFPYLKIYCMSRIDKRKIKKNMTKSN